MRMYNYHLFYYGCKGTNFILKALKAFLQNGPNKENILNILKGSLD